LLSFVPVTLDLYRTVRRHLHWTLQNLVSFADRTGRCFPSVRTLAAATGQPRSTVSRHLAQLAAEGVIARQRRPGGTYAYVVAARFLPTRRGVSHQREKGVPPARTEEQQVKKTGYARARFAKSGISYGENPDERSKWEARLRSWRQSRFWLPLWGPKPGEHGCFAPMPLLKDFTWSRRSAGDCVASR
jgi:DNA-binding transcriptional MocR family regulator